MISSNPDCNLHRQNAVTLLTQLGAGKAVCTGGGVPGKVGLPGQDGEMLSHPMPLELDHWTPGAHLLRVEFGVSRSSGDSHLEGTFHQEIYASCNALGRALWGSLNQYFSAVFTVFLIQNVIYRNRSRAEATCPLKKVFCTGNNSILLFFLALTRKLPVTLLPKLWKFESIEFPKFKLCIFLNVRIIRIYTNFKIIFMPFSNIPVYVFRRDH